MIRASKRLFTLIQVSDLHFGESDSSGDALLSAQPPYWWKFLKHFEGFMGHHYPALFQLSSFLRDLQEEKPRLIVTGDLTTMGSSAEMEVASKFLAFDADLLPADDKGRKAPPIGLGVNDFLDFAIPGNHDHWPASRRIVGKNDRVASFFRPLPFVGDPIPLGEGGPTLSLAFLNSDADVGSYSRLRVLARGQFGSQIRKLEQLLSPGLDDVIRPLLVPTG